MSLPWPIEIDGSKLSFNRNFFLSQYCASKYLVCIMLVNLLPGYDISCAGYVGGVAGQVVHVRRADDVVRVRQIEPVRLQQKSF